MRIKSTVCCVALALAPVLACTTIPPYEPPFETTRVDASGGELAVDQLIVLFDASGSIDPQSEFPYEKSLLESFVQGMPDGDYDAEIKSFGGKTRYGSGSGDFNRSRLASYAHEVTFLGEDTPLEEVLEETAGRVSGRRGTAAVVIISDGVPSRLGRTRDSAPTLAAAQSLVERHKGTVCFHTVHAGSEVEGRVLLKEISELTACGSARTSDSIDSGAPLYAFQREIFLSEGLVDVAAAPPPALLDSDGDGVIDADDHCPGTPAGVAADDRGCWSISEARFPSDSTEISPELVTEIASVATMLKANPDLRVRVDGYTDATGSVAYNQALSQRRAAAVQAAIAAQGVDPGRVKAQGHGESMPAAPNDTPEGRAANRRIEFTVLPAAEAG